MADTGKRPLLFIHGMWNRPLVWDWFVERYGGRGHAVLAPALPFHEAPSSPLPPAGLGTIGVRDYAEAILAEARTFDAPPVLIGHSMGGLLAQLVAERLMAEQRPPAGLVLLAPAPAVPSLAPIRTLSGLILRAGWWKKPTLLDRARARWGIFNNVPPEEAEPAIDAMVWDSGRALFQIALPWLDGAGATRVDHARLAMPALVVIGTEDRITPLAIARATARRLAGRVDYRELDGVGHWLFHAPVRDRITRELDAFLARLDAPQAA